MGQLVEFTTGFGGSGPKKVGTVTGFSDDGSGTFVKEKGTGKEWMPASRNIEVIDVKARLPEPGELHPEVQAKQAAQAAQAANSMKEMPDANGETVALGETVKWTRKAGDGDTFDRGGNGKLLEIRPDGSFVIESGSSFMPDWEVPAGRGTVTKIQPDAELDDSGKALVKSLENSARNAGWSNDGYDRAATGRESAFREAGKMVTKKGVTPEVVADLRAQAEKEKGQLDYMGYADYDAVHAGSADGYTQAADMIEKALNKD